MGETYWREASRQVIYPIICQYKLPLCTEEIKQLKKEISDVYPFGERKYYPYKIWLEEVKKVLLNPERAYNKNKNFTQLNLFN